MNVHTEGLPMWGLGSRPDDAPIPEFDQVPPQFRKACGIELRDAALAQSAQGRELRIAMVRGVLIANHRDLGGVELTGDDVLAAIEGTDMALGDTRWTANVLRGWDMVRATDRYEPSTRPECHARPKRVWVWR